MFICQFEGKRRKCVPEMAAGPRPTSGTLLPLLEEIKKSCTPRSWMILLVVIKPGCAAVQLAELGLGCEKKSIAKSVSSPLSAVTEDQ